MTRHPMTPIASPRSLPRHQRGTMLTGIRRFWTDLFRSPAPKQRPIIQHGLLVDLATELAGAEANLARICSDRGATQGQRNAAAATVERLSAAQQRERRR